MLFDFVFFLTSAFCLCFAWTRYYINNNLVCLLLSTAATFLCFLLIKRLFFDKKHKKIIKKHEKNQTESLANFLSFLPEKQVTNLFLQLPQIAQNQPKAHKNHITINENEQTKKLVFVFENAPLTKRDFCKIAKENKADTLEIFATGFEKDLSQTAGKCPFKTKLFDKTDVYFLLKNANLLPDLPKEKNSLKCNFLYVVFDKSRAKYYLSSSLFLILTSFLTFFPLYYTITGTILFFVAIYAKFNLRFNHSNQKKEI